MFARKHVRYAIVRIFLFFFHRVAQIMGSLKSCGEKLLQCRKWQCPASVRFSKG